MAGNLIETISTFGQRKVSINSGPSLIEETIGLGVHETSMSFGKYKVTAGAGKFEISAPIGTVTLEGATVTVKGKVQVNVDAPFVKIGSGALIGGVVSGLPGKPNHADYVTGAPLKGSFKVSVG